MRTDAVVADEFCAVDAVAGGGLRVLAAVALLLAAAARAPATYYILTLYF